MLRDQGGMAWVNRVNGVVREIIHYRVGVISFQEEETRELLYRLSGRPVSGADIIHVRAPFGRAPVSLAISSLVAARVLNPNEARTWLDAGLAPYAGGDEFANPNTGSSQPGAARNSAIPFKSEGDDDNAE